MPIDNTKINCFGSLFEDSPSGTALNIVADPTYTPWISASAGLSTGLTFVTSDTTHTTADSLIIGPDGLGTYLISFSTSFSTSSLIIVKSYVYVNSIKQVQIGNTTACFGSPVTSSSFGDVQLSPGDRVSIRFATTSGSTAMNIFNCALKIVRISL